MTTLYTKDGSRYRPADPHEVRDAALATLEPIRGRQLSGPDDTAQYLQLKLSPLDYEVFAVVYLDNRHRIIEFAEAFRGTIDGTSVYPREIVREAIRYNAAAIILAHNHPSGIAEPSSADERITRRLKSALELIDVRVLDHLIVAGTNCTSLASRGLL